jgi:large subunit ribosomal protein L7/L12
MAKLATAEIIAAIKEMTVLELNDLVKEIETTFGVTAAAPVAAAAPVEEAAPAGPVEVKVTLTSAGGNKIAVIKAIQAITGLGLMDAKKLVDAAPALVKEKISPAEADGIKAKLVEAGASVEVK